MFVLTETIDISYAVKLNKIQFFVFNLTNKDKERYMRNTLRKGILMFSLVSVVLGLFVFSGCGGPAEQAPPPKPQEPRELSLPPAEGNLPTTSLLKLTPELAQLGMVLPSLAEGLDKVVQTAKRFYPADEVDGWIQNNLRNLAGFAGLPEAKSLIEIAEGRGFDITVPVGVFADLSPSFNDLMQILAPTTEAEAQGEKKKIDQIDWAQIKQPNWVLMLGVKDTAKVEESLKELVVEVPEISGIAPKEEIVDGAKVIEYGPYSYFISAKYVVVGSTVLVKDVANRFSNPYAIRYGTAEMPASSEPEGVTLIKDWKLIPMLNQLTPYLVQMSPYGVLAQMKLGPWAEMVSEGVDDPVYVCMSLNPEEKLQVRTLIDMSKRPKSASILGQANPLQLPKLFPDNTQASLFFQVTNEYKTYLTQTAVPQIKTALSDKKQIAQGLQYGSTAMGFLGNELGVGITGTMGDFPALIIVIHVSNVEQVKALLDMLVPSMQDEVYREIPVKKIAVPSPIPIAMVMVEDKVVVSNNTDVLKKMIDLVLDKQSSNYLANLNPPVDAGVPRYSLISIQSKLFLDTIFPLMSIMGQNLGGMQMEVEKALAEIREIRLINEKKDGLLEGQMLLFFNPSAK